MQDIIRTRIEELLKEKKMTRQGLSVEAGLGRTYVNDLFRRPELTPTITKLAALAKVLGTTPQYLMGEAFSATKPVQAQTLPVMGRVAGSAIGKENVIADAIEFTITPPGLEGVRDAYCLWVEGESMAPLYKPRDPVFVHPRQPYARGDIVVLQEEIDGSIYASIKEFVRNDDDFVVTRQFNPAGEVKFALKNIVAVHRVLPLREVLSM